MIPKFFGVKGLVSEKVYKDRGERSISLIDARIVITADRLRKRFGPAVVNNWSWGGAINGAGLRMQYDNDYRPYSQHSFGRALDLHFSNHEAEEVIKHILDNQEATEYEFITGIELDVSWLHIDCRNHNHADRIFTFTP
jgi:hypothetical protein